MNRLATPLRLSCLTPCHMARTPADLATEQAVLCM